MSRITGVGVVLATAAAVLTGSTAGAGTGAAPPTEAQLPSEVPRGVEVTLADGDTFRVWTSPDLRTVWGARHDAADGWGARRVVLRKKGLFCGEVDARTANGAVAVLAECDRHGYAEDQAPTSSHALWSAGTLTWSSRRLAGEAYEEPGISPDGSRAVWPESGGYLTWGPEGFARHALETPGQEYTATATITDDARVSYLYGSAQGRRCRVVVLTRTGDAAPSRQDLDLAEACSDYGFANVDAHTTWFGDLGDPAHRAVVSRPDGSSPWAVTAVAPAAAPGLVPAERGLTTDFFTAPGLPIVALGSPGRRRVRAQVYDAVTQTWGPARLVPDAGAKRCRWGENWSAQPLGVLLADLECGGRHVVLTTPDGTSWRALRMGRHPYGLSPDGRLVAVPARRHTHVVSPDRGVVTLPGGVRGRCDVVVPDGPGAAVLLTASGRSRGWPTVLKESTARGWRTVSRTDLPTPASPCRGARSSTYDLPYRFDVHGRRAGYTVQVLQRRGAWTVRRSRY